MPGLVVDDEWELHFTEADALSALRSALEQRRLKGWLIQPDEDPPKPDVQYWATEPGKGMQLLYLSDEPPQRFDDQDES